jgi:hypothetical protein
MGQIESASALGVNALGELLQRLAEFACASCFPAQVFKKVRNSSFCR